MLKKAALVLGLITIAGPALSDPLPFRDGRYLSDNRLCGLSIEQMVDRIGDEIHYVLYDIKGRSFSGAEFRCQVKRVARRGNSVNFTASCAMEGTVTDQKMAVTFISDTEFREGPRVFRRCSR